MDHNHQKVYPIDTDNTATENDDTKPAKYVMLSENGGGGGLRPPPYRRNVQNYKSTAPKKKDCTCGRCVLCCCLFLLIFILILSCSVFLFLKFYKPKIPSYKVQGLDVGAFNVTPDFSLYTEFIVNVRAENPNEKIGITYRKGSSVVVDYAGSTLCSGMLPNFHQGFKNTTLIKVVLSGKSEFGSGLQEALRENRETGRIPLLIMVKVPVSVMLGELPLRKIVVLVNCSLVVDKLAPKKKIGILSSNYSISATL